MSSPKNASLKDVVAAMSTETSHPDSTLGWDVVVSYNADEINKLLATSYKDDKVHVKELPIVVTAITEDGDQYNINYVFKLGPPLIQFASTGYNATCSLTMPVDGGFVKTPTKEWAINAGVYSIVISGISLATVDGSEGSTRIPLSQEKPFVFPTTGPATGVVTLDLKTSAASIVVKVLVSPNPEPPHVKIIDAQLGNLQQKILEFFQDPKTATSIRYDLARVNSSKPPEGSTVLVPKSFKFAIYASEEHPQTVLSLFIQTDDVQHGEQYVQVGWLEQWLVRYKVPPIPSTHSASIVFNNRLMYDSMIRPAIAKRSFEVERITMVDNKPVEGIQMKLRTHMKVHRDQVQNPPGAQQDGVVYETTGTIDVDVDQDPNRLLITLSQHGDPASSASGRLQWNFQYNFSWSSRFRNLKHSENYWGSATVSNTLDTRTACSLSDYALRLNASIHSYNWSSVAKPDNVSFWDHFWTGGRSSYPSWVKEVLPQLPTFDLDLVNMYFFFTTNLLLPDRKVIDIDTAAGLRIPRDFYIVGHVEHAEKVEARIREA